jgi:hypothetical protein
VVGTARADGPFAALGAARSLAHLRDRLAHRALHHGVDELDAAAIRAHAPRAFTQEVSRVVFECTEASGEPQFDGIAYRSRLGDELENWAIFEPPTGERHGYATRRARRLPQHLAPLLSPAPQRDALDHRGALPPPGVRDLDEAAGPRVTAAKREALLPSHISTVLSPTMARDFIEALTSDPVTVADARRAEKDGGIPDEPGVYAWWLASPDALPTVLPSPHPTEPELRLLYVGIAPKDATSNETLRTRVLKKHLGAGLAGSTFRRSLAALLWEKHGWTPRLTDTGTLQARRQRRHRATGVERAAPSR